MRRFFHDLKILILANLWIIPVLAGLVTALLYFVAPPAPMYARIATGPEAGGYHAFALKLKEELAKSNFNLELVPSRGSRENLQKLLSNDVQLAVIQSGQERTLDERQRDQLLGLGIIYHEPLWLFSRGDLSAEQLLHMQDLRLGIGRGNSGTQAVTMELFKANHLLPAQYPANWQEVSGSAAADALLKGELEAAFFLGPVEDPLIQRLAAHPELNLISLPRTDAYLAYLPYLTKHNVSEGLLNLATNSPKQDIVTLGPVATLISNEEFHPSLTPLILEAARVVLREGRLLDAADTYPQPPPVSLETLPEAEYYYEKGLPILQRYLPFRIASLADRYIILAIPLLILLFPLAKAIGPIYQWRIRARIYRWYRYLREVDYKIYRGKIIDVDEEIAHLLTVEEDLARIDVPLSYSNELYQLHVHLAYMIQRLRDLKQPPEQAELK